MMIKRYLKFLYTRIQLKKKSVYISILSYSQNSVYEGKNNIARFTKLKGVKLGFGTYVGANVDFENAKIGKYCSIGNNIKIHRGQHPTKDFISTHPAFYSPQNPSLRKTKLAYTKITTFKSERVYTKNGNSLEVGNDVWIGNDVRFMEGVTISDGAIIASNALVTKDIPPYAIAAGIPAKIIKHRFRADEIEYLTKLQWWDKEAEWLNKNSEYFFDLPTLKKELSE